MHVAVGCATGVWQAGERRAGGRGAGVRWDELGVMIPGLSTEGLRV